MKRNLFIFMLLGLLASCQQDGPKATKQVTFRVQAFEVETEPMSVRPRQQTAIYDEATDGTALTDLYIFSGTTQLVHQTSDDANFGTVTMALEYGATELSFVLTRSTGQSYADGVLSAEGLRSTFGKVETVTVGDATDAFDVVLDRVNGQLCIQVEDAIPAGADRIVFQIADRYMALDVSTMNGVNGSVFEQSASLASSVGVAGKQWCIACLSPTYGTAYTADVTLTVYGSSDEVMAQHTIADVPINTNTKTLLHGEMFSGQTLGVTVNTAWAEDVDGGW